MHIENNLGKCATRATAATLLGRLRQRRSCKNIDIQGCCASILATEPESTGELSRHSVAPLTDEQPFADVETPPAPFKADDLAHGGPCPYSDEQLATFRVSNPHLICCGKTMPPWNWRYRKDCPRLCNEPCNF